MKIDKDILRSEVFPLSLSSQPYLSYVVSQCIFEIQPESIAAALLTFHLKLRDVAISKSYPKVVVQCVVLISWYPKP